MNFFGNDFQAWKLRTLNDYLMFFFFIFAGALIFVLITKHMNRQKAQKTCKKTVFIKRKCDAPSSGWRYDV